MTVCRSYPIKVLSDGGDGEGSVLEGVDGDDEVGGVDVGPDPFGGYCELVGSP